MQPKCGQTIGMLGSCLVCLQSVGCNANNDDDADKMDLFCDGGALPPPPPPALGCGGSGSASSCSQECADRLLPLMNGTCAPIVQRLFDGVRQEKRPQL